MSSITGRRPGLGTLDAGQSLAVPSRATKILGWSAAVAISFSIIAIIAATGLLNSWSIPRLPLPAIGPPWQFPLLRSLTLTTATLVMWTAAVVGGVGVAAALAAVARGARPPIRVLIAGAFVATALLTVLPPAGSTDVLDYAAYGRMVVLGHTPYVMTPQELRVTGDPVAAVAPRAWQKHVSVYGPAATAEQWAAATLGGTSPLRIVLWLKLWNALAFLAVVLALDRMLRRNPARRARAHLLWSVNPLLLWGLLAAGHVDVVAAAGGLLGLVLLGDQPATGDARLLRALGAGVLVGLAADIKITYALFGAGIVWSARRTPAVLITAAAGAIAVILPTYLWFGPPAVKALLARSGRGTVDSFYPLLGVPGPPDRTLLVVSVIAFLAAAALLLWRLPDAVPAWPAITPALALAVAFLFIWPYQLPWYDAMGICLLALYPASRLDWLVLIRLTVGTVTLMPGNGQLRQMRPLLAIVKEIHLLITPAIMLAATACLIALCLFRAWKIRPISLGTVRPPAAKSASLSAGPPA